MQKSVQIGSSEIVKNTFLHISWKRAFILTASGVVQPFKIFFHSILGFTPSPISRPFISSRWLYEWRRTKGNEPVARFLHVSLWLARNFPTNIDRARKDIERSFSTINYRFPWANSRKRRIYAISQNWRQFFMGLSCYRSWISSQHCQSSCGSTRR